MITVYGRRNSSSVQLVLWALHEIGVDHERLDYGHGHASTQSDDFLVMNPMGRVPVLTDGALCLFESAAILRYLGAAYGNDVFWPKDAGARARLDVWAEWGKNTFADAVLDIFVYDVRLDPKTRDPAILTRAVEAVIPLAEILDRRIGQGPWLDGEQFSFADIACGYVLYRYYALDWDRPYLANLAGYYERLQQRPAFRDHVMVSYEALRGTY